MAVWDDVRRIISSLPEVHEVGSRGLIADDSDVYFTTPHFNGYPAILVQLPNIGVSELEELLVEAWLSRAPKRLAKDYLASTRPDDD